MSKRVSQTPLLTPREAANRLGVSTRTLANWVGTGQIGRGACVVLPSGHRRYRAVRIDALAQRRERA